MIFFIATEGARAIADYAEEVACVEQQIRALGAEPDVRIDVLTDPLTQLKAQLWKLREGTNEIVSDISAV